MAQRLIKWKDKLGDIHRLIEALDLIVSLDREILNISLDLDGVLNQLLQGLLSVSKSSFCQILLRKGNKLYIANSTEKTDLGNEFKIEDCLAGKVVEDRSTVYSGNVLKEYPDRYKWILGRGSQTQMRSQLSIPIFSPTTDKVLLGVLNSESPDENAYDEEHIQIASQFALQAGVALHNLHFQEGIKLTMEIVDAIQSGRKSPEEGLRDVLSKLSNYFGNDVVVQLLSIEPKRNSLVVWCSTVSSTENTRVLLTDSFCGMVFDKKTSIRSNDVTKEYPNQFKDTIGNSGQKPTRSEMASPMIKQGIVVGILNIESPHLNAFNEHDEYLLSMITRHSEAWIRTYSIHKSLNAFAAMETIGDAASNLIHITRNTGTSMAYDLEQLKKICSDKCPSAVKYVENVSQFLSKLDKRIDEVEQRYASGQHGPERVRINEFIRGIIREVITRNNIVVEYELDDNLTEISVSPGFKDVVWNLASNAQKAINEGTAGTITVGTKLLLGQYTKEIEGFTFWVKDTGVGISKDDQENMHDPRFTSKEKGGFGLFWVRTFVERWGGKLEIASELGKGATFSIVFPLNADGTTLESYKEE